MAEQPSSSLNEIQALHSDLLALSNSRLSNLDRLAIELEAHITAFRNLLNQKNRNEQSRQSITNGTYFSMATNNPLKKLKLI